MDLTIAVIGPFSDGEAVMTRPMLSAVRGAVHAAGPAFGAQVSVRASDDYRDPDHAVRLIERCIEDPQVIGVIGPKNSGSALAVMEMACSAGLPLLLPSATADGLAGYGSILRMCAPDSATASAATRLVAGLGATSLWVEADETAYGDRLASAVQAAATTAGIALSDHPKNAEAAFLAMGEVEQAERMAELRDSGYEGHLIGAEGGPGAPLAELGGDAAEGSWQLYPGTHAGGHSYVYAAEAAAATRALLRAHDATGDRTEIATWLRRRDREVVSSELGPLWFGGNGERDGAHVTLWRLEGGRSVPCNIHPSAGHLV